MGTVRLPDQRAASSINAMESGPPETASNNPLACESGARSDSGSKPLGSGSAAPSINGRTAFRPHPAASALVLLRLTLGRGADIGGGVGVFSADFAKSGAGLLLGAADRVKRLAEPQHGLRRAGGARIRG